jgi:amino acid transporter, AAT family
MLNEATITDDGLQRGLNKRHVRMIAIGGAIGTGLFLGSGRAITLAGPSLVLVYLVTGIVIFVIMRALGELLIYRPVTGSFADYAGEFLGPIYGFITGWGYWITWTVIGMAELTAAGIYVHYWFPAIPQYVTIVVFIAALVFLNLLAVGAFGEAEFWFASVKILTILVLLGGGTLAMLVPLTHGHTTGTVTNLWEHGGVAPHGWLTTLLTFQIVVFAYQGVELVGMTASECRRPAEVMPKAINSIPWRIALFYVGSIIVLLSLIPWTQFTAGQSPYVQAFEHLGIPAAAGVMNFVVLTAALSSCSSGIYGNARLLKRLAADRIAPRSFGATNGKHVPAMGVLASGTVMLIGVAVNYLAPENAFVYITSVATLGAIWCWGVIVVCHLVYRRRVARGDAAASAFRLRAATPACWAVLAFLFLVTVLLAFDPSTRVALYAAPLWAVLLVGGYAVFGRRHSRRETAEYAREVGRSES